MQREISASTTVPVPFPAACAQLREDPGALFGSGSVADRRIPGVIAARVGAGAMVEHAVVLEVGRVHLEEQAASVPVEWAPDSHERVLPSFVGRLLLVPEGERVTRLELFGTYHVPLGAVGRFGDTVVGRRVARASVSELVERVAARIDRAYVAAVDDRPPTPTPYNVDMRELDDTGLDGGRPEHFIG